MVEYKEWLNNALSEEQLSVFEDSSKHKCIFASAGSGKTRTLVHLIVDDLVNGIPPEKIVAFTFTEKAAKEMLNRVHHIMTQNFPVVKIEGISIGTIHSWCYQYLLTQSDYYNFVILDELQAKALATRLYDYLKLADAYSTFFPKGIDEFLIDVDVYLNECLSSEMLPNRIKQPLVDFLNLLRNNRLFTFGTVIQCAIESLDNDGKFDIHRLYVDEYQDVNPSQVKLIKGMLGEGTKLTVIGDDLQCIYNWRGSDVNRIVNFRTDFKESKIYRLNTNYRSRPAIISIGNTIAESILLKDPEKKMLPNKKPSLGKELLWYSASNLTEEISLLTESIKALIASGIPSNKIAILLRSVRSSGREIYDALFQAGIPVECPTFSDAEEFIVEFCIPLFGWLEINKEAQNEEEEEELRKVSEGLFNQAARWSSKKDLDEDIFWGAIEKWKDQLKENTSDSYNIRSNLYQLLDTIEIKVDLDSLDLMVGLGIASQIIRSVEEIHRRRLAEQNRKKSISLIKEARIALRENYQDFGESIPLEIQGNGILITTVHQSKGLEWPVIFIPRLSGRRFPLSNSKHRSSFDESITLRYGTTIDDERRLFYVACTRAEEKLIIIDESNTQPNLRSQFVKDYVESKGSTPLDIPPLPSDLTNGIEFQATGQNNTQRIGLSDVLVYLECPFQYGLKNRLGIQQPIQDNLGYGKGLHEIIQRRFDDDKDWDAQEIESNVKKNVSLPYTSQTQEQISQGAISKMLAGLQQLGIFKSKVKTEVNVEVYFPEGIVEGVIDNIEILSDGVVLRDWKANIHEEFIDRYKKQLMFYHFALRQKGTNVKSVEIVDVKKSVDTGVLNSINITETEANIDAFITTVREALKGIQSNLFTPTKNYKACESCDLSSICKLKILKNESTNKSS